MNDNNIISDKRVTEEKDACAIIAFVNKRGHSTHANIVQTIDALRKMGHRSGDINGEGDGCGITVDIPRDIWKRRLASCNLSPHLAESNNFFVGHLMLPKSSGQDTRNMMSRVRETFRQHGAELLLEIAGETRNEELEPRARAEAPLFWQIGGIIPEKNLDASRKRLFLLQLDLEKKLPEIHITSLSLDSVIFKVQGMPDLLPRVFPELQNENMHSVMTLGHGRYSTNTLPTVILSQPFSLLGHNGEINTIERLRSSAKALGIDPVPGGSDSQDLNRVIEGLVHLYDLDILEAVEMVFPAIYSEVAQYDKSLQKVYAFYRWFFPCSAQGPAAVLTRNGDVCMGSVDALGLRPLWLGESDYSYFLSSEKGVVDLERNMSDPRPLAPGEKVAIFSGRGKAAEVLDYGLIQHHLVSYFASRHRTEKYMDGLYKGIPSDGKGSRNIVKTHHTDHTISTGGAVRSLHQSNILGAFGWQKYDILTRQRVAHSGREVIGSMGHTGPLAAFVPESWPNISDYCKENIAVVTNPAIDREREAEHFSTRVVLGSRPDIHGEKAVSPLGLELDSPLLLGSYGIEEMLGIDQLKQICQKYSTSLFEDVIDFFTCQQRDTSLVQFLDTTFDPSESLKDRLKALAAEAQKAVELRAVLIILDDSRSFSDNRVFIDPFLAVSFIQESLIEAGMRREVGLVVRSAAIRNLHDIMLLLGLGADALHPYLLWRISCNYADARHPPRQVMDNTFSVLQKGIEKVMSTMGIHELCGYGRIFSAIGLKRDLADILKIPNFCSSDSGGLGLADLQKMATKRYARTVSAEEEVLYREPARNPKVGRILRNVATGKTGYREMTQELEQIAEELPTGIRHLLQVKKEAAEKQLTMDKVDISVGEYDLPLVIAAMSLGSQGENSFRAYAKAAKKVNVICINGEGGEIPDMLGKYRRNRGQQIASGRFGVFMGFLNSAAFLEIKIGQGAKPGEGGHLPGSKVSEMVAKARHCKAGITLISPSNHHDIYSIEDLAQIITELKTANPHARISVKIPVSSGIGTIAVGVAKAGADILNISGFEGGTGAAREHAKRFVGLPAEIGVSEAHQALVESGLRDDLEIWADGGMRSGDDVLKLILLGANRVGLGTVVLMGIGCISCRQCHLDRCPRGISTQLQTRADAEAGGVKGFRPRDIDEEAENLARLLSAIGDELRMRVAELGVVRLQDLVGKTELLQQYRMGDKLDVASVLKKPLLSINSVIHPHSQIVRKPLSYLTRLISDLTMERFKQGETVVRFAEDGVQSTDRAIGTYLAGVMERRLVARSLDSKAVLQFGSSVPGNGLCAFMSSNIEVVVDGGSQDGAAKGSMGGLLGVFRGKNLLGRRIDGSTGKSFAYGAIGGLLMVQNMTDSRACVRLSGADVVLGGRITAPIRDDLGNIASRAHLKGFAFEYMTGGRVVVLGDPGPWICAGMTGGIIYQCLYPEYGFDRKAVERRLARAANVKITAISSDGLVEVNELLGNYIDELKKGFQDDESTAISTILHNAAKRFVMITAKPLRPASAE
jgi:glutamate synthase (NADPH) large chain